MDNPQPTEPYPPDVTALRSALKASDYARELLAGDLIRERALKSTLVPYVYWATTGTVHDGDTLTATVDLGFGACMRQSFRLLGCNARELTQSGGPEARDHLAALLPLGSQIKLASVKPDKFGGRYDAAITLPDGTDLVSQLVAGQWAAAWDGTGAKPVPPWPRTVTP